MGGACTTFHRNKNTNIDPRARKNVCSNSISSDVNQLVPYEYLNPENILVNMFALRNLDPDISTGVAHYQSHRVHVSSGARVEDVSTDSSFGIGFRLRYVQFETSYTVVAGLNKCPESLRIVNGEEVQPVENLDELSPTQSGWLYRPVDGLVFIRYYHPASIADLELVMESTNSSGTLSSLINSDGKPEEE